VKTQQIIKSARSKLNLRANVSYVNYIHFSSLTNCAPNKFSVLKHSLWTWRWTRI